MKNHELDPIIGYEKGRKCAVVDYWQWLRAPTSIRQSSHFDHLASGPDWHILLLKKQIKKRTQSNPLSCHHSQQMK